MSADDFPFKVGDKVRIESWKPNDHVIITAIGRDRFLSISAHDGVERSDTRSSEWLPYVEPSKRTTWVTE